MTDKRPRSGRPTGGNGYNREKILTAARELFAGKDFGTVTMRAIAAEAGCDVALVAHYFGSKETLFAETMQVPPEVERLFIEALTAPRAQQGEQLARGYLGLWEAEATGKQMLVFARSMMSNEVGGGRFRDLLARVLGNPQVAASLDGRAVGFSMAMSHLLGTALGRYLVRVPALAEPRFEEIIARAAPAVQMHLDTSDPAIR